MHPGADRDVSVAVVVPCFNEQRSIGRLLRAVAGQHPPPREIVIIDGGSTDGTLREIERIRATIEHIKVDAVVAPELSLPRAINFAVRRTSAPIVVRLDAHSEPSDGYIAQAIAHLSDATVGVVGGLWRIEPGSGTDLAAAIARAVSHPLGAGDAAYRIASAGEVPIDVDTVPFGCFRRDTWERLGGLNEQLLGNEDYEFNYRAQQAGLAVRLDPGMQCKYVARATLGALAVQYFRYGWCKVQMLRLYPDALRWRQAVPSIFVFLLAVLSIASVWMQLARLALLATVAVYLGTLLVVAVAITLREGHVGRGLRLPAAFATLHLTWGSGAIVHLLTAGRWPDRTLLFGLPARSRRQT
jgi:succinoglycan biosynthesis protein ExoA